MSTRMSWLRSPGYRSGKVATRSMSTSMNSSRLPGAMWASDCRTIMGPSCMAEPHPEVVDPQHPLVVRLRETCLRYPEAVEVQAWGRPTFRAGKKIFVVAGSSMEVPLTMVFKPEPDDAPALRQDARIFSPPYFGPAGW